MFRSLADSIGSYVMIDEETMLNSRMDVARIILRYGWKEKVNAFIKVIVNGQCFDVFMVEDALKERNMVSSRRIREEDVSDSNVSMEEEEVESEGLGEEPEGMAEEAETAAFLENI